MMEWLERGVRLLNEVPFIAWAMIAGTVISWGITQRLKKLLPDWCRDRTRDHVTQGIAFVMGLSATFAIVRSEIGFIGGIAVGLWSPMFWELLMAIIGSRKPEWRKALSGDVK